MWPKTFTQFGNVLNEDAILLIKVRIDVRDDERRVSVMDITVPDVSESATGPVMVYIAESRITPATMDSLREVLSAHPGTNEVRLTVVMADREIQVRTEDRLRVKPSPSLFADLKALLGSACLEPPATRSS